MFLYRRYHQVGGREARQADELLARRVTTEREAL